MAVTYPTLESWLNEFEGHAMRVERMPPEARQWVEAAWWLAYWAGVEQGRKIAVITLGDEK